jgi:hypothetical protein
LFTYIILLYLAYNSYHLSHDNYDSYKKLLANIDDPLIVNISFVNSDQKCPDKFEEIFPAFLNKSVSGCNCDGEILRYTQCALFSHSSSIRQCNETDLTFASSRLLQENTGSNSASSSAGVYDECKICYSNYTGLQDDIKISNFYESQKICILKDKNLNTLNFLKTVDDGCDEANSCNMFFCKLDSSDYKVCPISQIIMNGSNNYFIGKQKYDGPFVSANSFEKYFNYDTRSNPYIYLPLIDILIAKSGDCENNINSNTMYPLLSSLDCPLTSRSFDFDQKSAAKILINNKVYDKVTSALPYYMNYTGKEIWKINYRTAFVRDTLYCILTKRNLFKYNLLTRSKNDTKTLEERSKKQEAFIDIMYSFLHIEENVQFQNITQKMMIFLNVTITVFEVLYVLFKMFNVFGDSCKIILFFCSYEGYVSLFADLFIFVLGGYTKNVLDNFSHHIEELIETNCLDEFVESKLICYKMSAEVIADKSLEIFLILLIKFILLFASIVYNCIKKKGKMTCREVELVIFEKEEEEDDDDDEENEYKPRRKRLRIKKSTKENKKILSETNINNNEAPPQSK